MKMIDDCIEVFEYTFQGIPCLIGVTDYHHQKPYSGSPYNCDSPDDYYGYTDIGFVILDRKGYHAKWLERKLNKEDSRIIEERIHEYMQKEESYY